MIHDRRKLFCQISPLTYSISEFKCRLVRHIKDTAQSYKFAKTRVNYKLPVVIYSHKSLIRRKLGNVNQQLQDNKAVNLKIASSKISGIIIRPGEIFSFWNLVSSTTERKGYKKGLVINNGILGSGIGGGMCQFTNLIHWLVLHSPLDIIEHHHHNGMDLFPDFNRQVPFGIGTSIMYNYLDYRFANNTGTTFQLITYTDDQYLYGELLADKPLDTRYHIDASGEYFYYKDDSYYRHNSVYRKCIDIRTGEEIENKLLIENNSKVMYDSKFIRQDMIV